MRKYKILEFLKIYTVFLLCAFLVHVLILEVLIAPSLVEERREFVSEHGVRPYIEFTLGATILYAIFNIPGSLIFYFKKFNPKRMGVLSLIFGFILEFSRVLPGSEEGGASWVQEWYNLEITGGTIVGTIISGLYWFAVWAIPTFIIQKYFKLKVEEKER